MHPATVDPPYRALETRFTFVCKGWKGNLGKYTDPDNYHNAYGLNFVFDWTIPGTDSILPNIIYNGQSATSFPVLLPSGKVRITFTLTDTRAARRGHKCEDTAAVTSIDLNIQLADPEEIDRMMGDEALESFREGDATESLQTLSVLTNAVFAKPLGSPTPRLVPMWVNDTDSDHANGTTLVWVESNSTNTTTSSTTTTTTTTTTRSPEQEAKEMEQRDQLVSVVSAILEGQKKNLSDKVADLIVCSVASLSGGANPAVLSSKTSMKAADTLTSLAGTRMMTKKTSDSFATTASNIVANVGGEVKPEHAHDRHNRAVSTRMDAKTQKGITTQVFGAVDGAMLGLLPPRATSRWENDEKPVSAVAANGAFRATARRATKCEKVTIIENGNVTFEIPIEWRRDCTGVGRHRRASGGAIMTSQSFDKSPFLWAQNNSAEGNVGGLDLSEGNARDGGSMKVKRQKVCGKITIRYAEQAQYSMVHTVTRDSPLTLAFNRTQNDLEKSLHFIVEPYHYQATDFDDAGDPIDPIERVDAFLRTTPQLTTLTLGQITSSHFNHSFVPKSVRNIISINPDTAQPAAPQAVQDLSHVLHLVPAHDANNTCNHRQSQVTGVFNESHVTYTLVITTNSSRPVHVHVRNFHAECVFNEVGARRLHVAA